MNLTSLGEKLIKSSFEKRQKILRKLINGEENISKYISNAMCYDVTAFARYLHYYTPTISSNDLYKLVEQAWLNKFRFTEGKRWTGGSIMPGVAIGFKRTFSNGKSEFFHAAISIGGTKIRSVNGLLLGAGWMYPADLNVLGKPNNDGFFYHDNILTEIYLSNF